jgi:hypothetical protein
VILLPSETFGGVQNLEPQLGDRQAVKSFSAPVLELSFADSGEERSQGGVDRIILVIVRSQPLANQPSGHSQQWPLDLRKQSFRRLFVASFEGAH